MDMTKFCEQHFKVFDSFPPAIPKYQLNQGVLVGRLYEAAEIEGAARLDINTVGQALVTLPRVQTTFKTDEYYLRARVGYRMLLHVMLKSMPEDVEIEIKLHPDVSRVLSLLSFEKFSDTGMVAIYVVPQVPVQIKQFFPIADIVFVPQQKPLRAPKEKDTDKEPAPPADKPVKPEKPARTTKPAAEKKEE